MTGDALIDRFVETFNSRGLEPLTEDEVPPDCAAAHQTSLDGAIGRFVPMSAIAALLRAISENPCDQRSPVPARRDQR